MILVNVSSLTGLEPMLEKVKCLSSALTTKPQRTRQICAC